jgi:hypothetical protein
MWLTVKHLLGRGKLHQECRSTRERSVLVFTHKRFPKLQWSRWTSVNNSVAIGFKMYDWGLRHYATSRKVAGSVLDEVIGFFNWPNPCSRTMALGSTQLLTEMSTRNLPGGKGRPARKADHLTAIRESVVWKIWEPRRLTNLWAFRACYRDSFSFF